MQLQILVQLNIFAYNYYLTCQVFCCFLLLFCYRFTVNKVSRSNYGPVFSRFHTIHERDRHRGTKPDRHRMMA